LQIHLKIKHNEMNNPQNGIGKDKKRNRAAVEATAISYLKKGPP
jgi:hypothetical protein